MANNAKTNGEQTANKRPNGTFAPGHKLGNRFAKGESGNSAGRPKLTRLSEALREQLAEEMPNAPERTIAEVIARTLIKLAISGDVQAIREIADRTEGKPKQAIDLDLQVSDWRTLAKNYGISTTDIIAEAQLLIAESIADSGSE
jgi:Holliday junction resolvasome RuvABC ATP-dependent DNA helicase subunit